jgi:hypothetical protein
MKDTISMIEMANLFVKKDKLQKILDEADEIKISEDLSPIVDRTTDFFINYIPLAKPEIKAVVKTTFVKFQNDAKIEITNISYLPKNILNQNLREIAKRLKEKYSDILVDQDSIVICAIEGFLNQYQK